jgi:hypothetical protein
MPANESFVGASTSLRAIIADASAWRNSSLVGVT